ncbi:ABC transporter ATP-binding protein [Lachnoclostridium sp. An14]|uniref:ABC transporter ATP-binding protein n=1 Tax=Lachnoclostridium sp. An14 TaxID=1965562 RepID=UPI00117A5FF4|nr:ABC transporter ATP-binding protein [Lachnoclostridium sp. An14]
MSLALEMQHITKIYGEVRANDDVSIQAAAGEVLCIIGENGAGKSTLMNVLYGMTRPDGGTIRIGGKEVSFRSSRDAMRHRIGMVFQHFMLVKELSCQENIIIGMEPAKHFVIDRKAAKTKIEALMDQYGMRVALEKPAGELSVGEQQKLEIIKVLYRGADIIILDEPTAVLTPQETAELFVNIRQLAAAGKTVIMITHKLDEVMQVADRIVVMRMGKVVGETKPADTDVHGLSVAMVGAEIPPMRERKETRKEKALEVCGVTCRNEDGIAVLDCLSMVVNKGEILGIAGISGNGQPELARVVTGLLKPQEGKVLLMGEDITAHDRKKRIQDGISFIPEDRNSTGACLDWSIEDNCIAGYQDRFTGRLDVIDREKARTFTESMIQAFRIKTPDGRLPISSLSGGNCQKVIVARETAFQPELVVAAEPTRGVDIGAISAIHNHMIELRNEGTAVLLISSSLDEIFELSDRIAVMFEGKLTALLDPKQVTREEIGLYMSGAKREEELQWEKS